MQQILKILILTFSLMLIAACKSKPSEDKSVEYKDARSIPSLQLPTTDKATKR